MRRTENAASPSGFSLRGRLLRRLLVPLLVLMACSGVASYTFALYYANSVYDDWLYDSANSLALAIEDSPAGPRLDLSESARRLFEWDAMDDTHFNVRGSHSGLIGGHDDLPEGIPTDATPFRDALFFNSRVEGKPVRVVALRVDAPHGDQELVITVAETENKRHALARRVLLSTLVPQALLVAAAGILIAFGIRDGLAPLEQIAGRIDAQSAHALTPLPDTDVPREVRALTRALNNLLERLEAAMVAQRRFVADAAHQLRTPLTGLRLNIEQAQEESTLDGVRPLLAQLRLSTERATRLSNQLLALARAEPGAGTPVNAVSLDLAELAREVGAEWVPRALGRNLDLSFSAEATPTPTRGDPVLIREALNNLLDNAVKYHPPGGGAIALRVSSQPRPAVTVTDDGPGIPEAQRADMFRRFARGDRSQNIEGSGLGLSIVREIAQAHHGEVLMETAPGGRGLSVRFELGAT